MKSVNVGLNSIAATLVGREDMEDQVRKRSTVINERDHIMTEVNKISDLRAFLSEGTLNRSLPAS